MIRDVTIDSSYFGIQFLPVEKKLYLNIQSLLRRIELRFSSLKETVFIYRNQLIWYIKQTFLYSMIVFYIYIYSGVALIKMILV
jgi:hypothetical protein